MFFETARIIGGKKCNQLAKLQSVNPFSTCHSSLCRSAILFFTLAQQARNSSAAKSFIFHYYTQQQCATLSNKQSSLIPLVVSFPFSLCYYVFVAATPHFFKSRLDRFSFVSFSFVFMLRGRLTCFFFSSSHQSHWCVYPL